LECPFKSSSTKNTSHSSRKSSWLIWMCCTLLTLDLSLRRWLFPNQMMLMKNSFHHWCSPTCISPSESKLPSNHFPTKSNNKLLWYSCGTCSDLTFWSLSR
jgi:hypothetical protein